MLRGLLGGIATCCIPLICVMPSLLKEGGPLAVGGFYGAVLLQLERMAQPRRVYGKILKNIIEVISLRLLKDYSHSVGRCFYL